MDVITFDPFKRIENLRKHGLDFSDLDMEFFSRAIILPAKQGRFMAIGAFERTVIAVVFSPLGSEGVSVISMRRASRKERMGQ